MTQKAITLDEGKYAFVLDTDTGALVQCLRHGEPWPAMFDEIRYSKAILSLIARAIELEKGTKS
jgi:hypothetical protein